MTVSGTNADGTTFENDLTYLIMQSTRKLMFDQPLIDFRYTDGMSKKLWNEVVALIKTGTGFPGIFYDPICIRPRRVPARPRRMPGITPSSAVWKPVCPAMNTRPQSWCI